MLPSRSGHTSYGFAACSGIVYSVIFPPPQSATQMLSFLSGTTPYGMALVLGIGKTVSFFVGGSNLVIAPPKIHPMYRLNLESIANDCIHLMSFLITLV